MTTKNLEIVAGLAASAIWGGMYVVSKVVLGIISTAYAMFLWNYAFTTLEADVALLTLFTQPHDAKSIITNSDG